MHRLVLRGPSRPINGAFLNEKLLRPPETTTNTTSRTFDLAFNVLKVPEDSERLQSLDKFLSDNIDVLTNPLIFQRKAGDTAPSGDNFTIRGSQYKVIKAIKSAADEISESLNISATETLRVLCEAEARVPEEKLSSEKKTKKDPHMSKEETHQMYTFAVLKERRTILQLTRFLLNHESIAVIENKYSKDILEDALYINKMITFLESIITELQKINDTQLHKELINKELSNTIIEVLKTLVTILLKVSTTDSNVVQWFQLLSKFEFFHVLKDTLEKDAYEEIEALTSIVSLLSFGLNTKDDILDPSAPFASQPNAIRAIHDIIFNSSQNAIVLYAWSVILYALPEEVLSKAFTANEDTDQLSKIAASNAVGLEVFEMIDKTHKILSYDSLYSAILASFLICTVPLIQLTDNTSKTYYHVLKDAPNSFIEKFFTNPNTEKLLYLTKAKFPEVTTPYLRLLSINGAYAHNELSNMSTYMSILPNSSMDYEIDTELDTITLTDGLLVKPPLEQNPDVLMLLPPQTKGKLLPTGDQNTDAVIFQHSYNGWSLLGRIVQNIGMDPENQDLLLTILELITRTLYASDSDTTSEILEGLSAFLDDSDILDVLLKMFEQSLHYRNVPTLTHLVELLISLVHSYPQIVWSHLLRSDLLEHAGRGGLMATILGSVETVNGTYDFTIASLELFNALVVDCLSSPEELYSQKAEVIPKFTNYAAQVFESFMYWSYMQPHQKFEIATLILGAFTKMLYGVYAVDPESALNQKITSVLASSAKRVVTSFTVSLPDVRVVAPILAAIDAMSSSPTVFETSTRLGFAFTQFARSSIQFSKLIVSIRSAIGESPSTLEESLFIKSPQLIMIYAKVSSMRSDVLQLLTQLVSGSWPSGSPSLLSHLSDYYTNVLISSISRDLKIVHDDFTVKKSLFSFFSAVIEGNQKGLSMIFLNGRDIRDTKTDQPSLLKVLKGDVKNMDYYPNWLSIHLVDALAFAFNSWSSRRHEEKDEIEFVKTLVKELKNSKPEAITSNDPANVIQTSYKYKFNARLAEICALVIFPSKKEGSSSQPIIDLLSSDDIMNLIKPFYEPFAYRSSLHNNLNRNFEDKWPKLKLKQFIRAPLAITNRYGEGAVYDLRLLDGILANDPYWSGSELTPGYRSEVIAASVNLQLVSAQISAAKSWGALLTAYVKKVNVQPSFIKIVKKLLEANIKEGTSIEMFSEVYRARVELAFFLLQSASTQKSLENDDVKEILDLSLQLITSIDVDFLSSLSANASHVYRPLMRIIFRCLADSNGNTAIIEDLTSELLEFFEIVIAKGSTLLFDIVQTNVNVGEVGGRIEDILLIVSLFKALIACKPPTSFTSRLSTILVDFDTLKSLLNVYSNSHNLKVNDDVVFADLSLTYMVELISVDVVAEQLISSGLFSTLIQSPISLTIQEGGVFVQTNPKLHSIWTNGLLAIILILLSKFGVRLLSEISAFVSYFSKQFSSTIHSWSQDSVAITTAALQETEQIIIIQKAMQSLYLEYIQSSPGMSQNALEIVPGLDTSSGRKALIDSFNHFLAHPKYLTSRVIPTTHEEQRLFEGEDKIRTPLVEQLVAQIGELKETLSE